MFSNQLNMASKDKLLGISASKEGHANSFLGHKRTYHF